MNKLDFKAINAKLTRLMSPQAMSAINEFIESMPVKAGYGALVAGGIAWFIGGLAVVYATTVATDVAEIRAELVKSEALKPVVPQLKRTPVPQAELDKFVELVNPRYKDIDISSSSSSTINIKANDGRYFGAFREAINHAYNGGQRWRLSLESMCVGRECDKSFLSGAFRVNTLKIER